MRNELWIALGVIVFLLILFIFFDLRKKIFKKREKKETKPAAVEKPAEGKVKKEKKVSKLANSKMSLTKKVAEKKKNNEDEKKSEVEDAEIDLDEGPIVYERTPSAFASNTRRQMPYERRPMPRRAPISRRKKKEIKEQIKDLSPEMKAILFSNALGKYEDK